MCLFSLNIIVWITHLKFQFRKPNFSYFYLNSLPLQYRDTHPPPAVNPIPSRFRQIAAVQRYCPAHALAGLWRKSRPACGSSRRTGCYFLWEKHWEQTTCMIDLHKYQIYARFPCLDKYPIGFNGSNSRKMSMLSLYAHTHTHMLSLFQVAHVSSKLHPLLSSLSKCNFSR